MTVHRRAPGTPEFETVCRLTCYVNPENLRKTDVDQALTEINASKCGRCFEGGGGY